MFTRSILLGLCLILFRPFYSTPIVYPMNSSVLRSLLLRYYWCYYYYYCYHTTDRMYKYRLKAQSLIAIGLTQPNQFIRQAISIRLCLPGLLLFCQAYYYSVKLIGFGPFFQGFSTGVPWNTGVPWWYCRCSLKCKKRIYH